MLVYHLGHIPMGIQQRKTGVLVVWDMTVLSIHFFIVHHMKITIHLPYCNHNLVYDNNTRINYTLEDYVILKY